VNPLAALLALALAAEPGAQDVIGFDGGRYVVARSPELGCAIALQGSINRGSTLAFDEAIARAGRGGCADPWLLLESPGGLLSQGIELGKAVRIAKLRTIARYDCASACALIFLGGIERVLVGSRARIGLHQASSGPRGERQCASTLQTGAARDLRRYLSWVIPSTADEVVATLMDTSCATMTFVQGERAIALGLATRLERPDEDVFGPRPRVRDPASRD
jgi:ATP-dependent protease ClpP protease subunit